MYDKIKKFLFELELGDFLFSKIERRETVEYPDTQPLLTKPPKAVDEEELETGGKRHGFVLKMFVEKVRAVLQVDTNQLSGSESSPNFSLFRPRLCFVTKTEVCFSSHSLFSR